MVHRDTLNERIAKLPPDEAQWFVHDPFTAANVLDALEGDGVELEPFEVPTFLHALTISCELDADFKWPGVPRGQEADDFEGWDLDMVQMCVEAAATQCKKTTKWVLAKVDADLEKAMFLKQLRRDEQEHRQQIREARALIPRQKDLDLYMRYAASLDREYDRLMRHLESSQRARAGTLPAPIRIELEEG